MIWLIDNYDSFTYNLVQYLLSSGKALEVYRNDEITLSDIETAQPSALILSPGPGTPDSAGICLDVVRRFAGRIPILGVCLGHQTIAQAFGGRVVHARRLMHGKTSPVYHDGQTLFRGLPSPFPAMRYHSLVVERDSLPPQFGISAWTAEGEVMAIRHRQYPVEGVQFHPESILTEHGLSLLLQFLDTYLQRPAPQKRGIRL
ncbi:anthranilate synthase component II [Polycladomyces subterraneus]|uniref:Aminodeoxychorismate/anthranilate synthase component II n=1 Tax=Polycladomyces subterraneus TaxID=1016997 RepID=A0ABT8ILB4_9BACL|nr:aminodeoxychorismate/anthranilate synthase component II [Polycladomyces subterraneus]MDN4593500.1 aminodeoxychorismate/anthranilate synthase component II [Polycladomyces subterraneus]